MPRAPLPQAQTSLVKALTHAEGESEWEIHRSRLLETARAGTFDSMATTLVESKRSSSDVESKCKRDSQTSQYSDEGSRSQKWKCMLGLGEKGSSRRQKSKDLGTTTTSPRFSEESEMIPTLILPVFYSPRFISRDANGFFVASPSTSENMEMSPVEEVTGPNNNPTEDGTSRNPKFVEGQRTSAPELGYVMNGNGQRYTQEPEHTLSFESSKDEDKLPREMWRKERKQMRRLDGRPPSRFSSLSEEPESYVPIAKRYRSRSDGTVYESHPVVVSTESRPPSSHSRVVIESRYADDGQPGLRSLLYSEEQPLQGLSSHGNRLPDYGRVSQERFQEGASSSIHERMPRDILRLQTDNISPRPQSIPEELREYIPQPLSLSRDKRVVSPVFENPIVSPSLEPWERCGFNYPEGHHGTFPAYWNSTRLAEEYRSLIGPHPDERDPSIWV